MAPTGTGKTAAFALPILQRLLEAGGPAPKPRVLILAPTRELVIQIEREFQALGEKTPVTSVVVFGGVSASKQINALRRKPDIIVACPGRLLDLHGRRAVDLSGIEVAVFDEADHMFDLGFLPSIRRILAALPRRRQNLFFSATMPREIRRLTDEILHRPHVVELQHSRPADTIEHALYPVADMRKQDLLEHLLGEDDFTSAIVFLRTKARARRLAERLSRRGHNAIALQGNMSQGQRERALQGFRDGRYDVLVATDIAARGIDVAGVSHVINFDLPHTSDAYTHRIGRTGRSECQGKACSFVTSEDRAQVRTIEARLGKLPLVHVEGFGGGEPAAEGRGETRSYGRSSGGGRSNNARGGGGPRRPTGGRKAGTGRGAGSVKGAGSGRGASGREAAGTGRDTNPGRDTGPARAASTGPRAAFGQGLGAERDGETRRGADKGGSKGSAKRSQRGSGGSSSTEPTSERRRSRKTRGLVRS